LWQRGELPELTLELLQVGDAALEVGGAALQQRQ